MFKPVLLKQMRQFHFLKPLDIFMTLLKYANKSTSAKKVTLRDAEEDVEKIYIELKKTSDNVG